MIYIMQQQCTAIDVKGMNMHNIASRLGFLIFGCIGGRFSLEYRCEWLRWRFAYACLTFLERTLSRVTFLFGVLTQLRVPTCGTNYQEQTAPRKLCVVIQLHFVTRWALNPAWVLNLESSSAITGSWRGFSGEKQQSQSNCTWDQRDRFARMGFHET